MSQASRIVAESKRPISLTRTRAQTIRFHLLSTKGKVAFVALFVVVAVVVASVSWTRISDALSGATHSVAEGLVGSPTPQPTVDVRAFLAAQHRLDTAITDATNAVAAAGPYTDLADDRRKVNAALTLAKKSLNTDTTVTALTTARTRLVAAVGDLPSKTAAAKAAADKAAADKADAAAQSAQAAQAAAAEAAKQRQSGTNGSTGGSSGTQQAPASAPAPAPAQATVSMGVTAHCSTAASIVFTATGSGTVTLSAGGQSTSGSGSASLTVSGGPGSYSASATASSSVSIRFSSTGACS